ncbi:MAG: hypothetical protein B6244_10620 [Candidatus Cloacimonetes bacterium 4572_55]|nr:MAG: hypothetical protein B6244_10620 [Candidatus Cloacimonetes bacterium 4572_55]
MQYRNSIRVMIVDDSSFARDIIATILSADSSIEVVGTAIDGQDALDKLISLQPHLITMDIVMPRMGGLEAIEHIMAFHPTPILVVTSQQDSHIAFQALSKGALEVVEKPSFENMSISQNQREFISKIKLLAKVKIVAISSSTGGPKILAKILSLVPPNFRASIAIVQHIADGFAKSLVDWLNSVSPLNVKLAENGERVKPGCVYIAPTGMHFEFSKRGVIHLNQAPEEEGQRPSANMLLRSVARLYGRNSLGIILTGMGKDGAAGMMEMKRRRALTIAQNKETCVVFGMPKAAIEMGAVDKILSVDEIAEEIIRFAR